ncbi:MAG: hypothetical protein JWQ98_3228 [Chlorobi bacterium]|nr:hypothetical protein [Chlorobiota bacterium]
MNRFSPWRYGLLTIAMALPLLLSACSDTTTNPTPITTSSYAETRLIADSAGMGAAAIDAALVNPWGIAFGPTGILWVANNHSGTSTLYNADGSRLTLVVKVPGKDSAAGGAPTGMIYNPTSDFVIPGAGAGLFIYAGEDGTISAWTTVTTDARIVANRSDSGAVYKGIAMAANNGANFLYATNFKKNSVDVFDRNYQYVKSFTDPGVPAGYAPFGIQTIDGKLYVTFAKQKAPDNEDDEKGVGNGYVDIFNPDGTLSRRFASNGKLNSPWAVVKAPTGFGTLAGDILIGNFGDGMIGAYNPTDGSFIGFLHDSANASIVIDGLWGLTFGPTATSTTLYFTAGPDGEEHGLLGTLKPI